jgi:hypothetical protein
MVAQSQSLTHTSKPDIASASKSIDRQTLPSAICWINLFKTRRGFLAVAQVSVVVKDFKSSLEIHSLDTEGIKSWRSLWSEYSFVIASFHCVIRERACTKSGRIANVDVIYFQLTHSQIRYSLRVWSSSPRTTLGGTYDEVLHHSLSHTGPIGVWLLDSVGTAILYATRVCNTWARMVRQYHINQLPGSSSMISVLGIDNSTTDTMLGQMERGGVLCERSSTTRCVTTYFKARSVHSYVHTIQLVRLSFTCPLFLTCPKMPLTGQHSG